MRKLLLVSMVLGSTLVTFAHASKRSSNKPVVSLSLTSLTFASQTVATTSPAQSVTLTNTGNASLSISGISPSGNFAETNNCGSSLAASASCTISVTFTPTASGTLTGAISFTDNGASSPQKVSLSGTAVAATAPVVSLSSMSLTFASQTVATTSAAQAVTLTNTGTASLSISGIAASGSFAETNNCGSSLAASASCTISVTFTPTTSGTLTGAISFTDNGASSPQKVSLSGTAVAAAPALTVTSTSLPNGTVGTAYTATLTAANGTAPYTWTDPACSGSCNTGMSFGSNGVLSGTPANAGTSTFTFAVVDAKGNTATKQLSITIAAAATAPVVSLSPTSLTFASQTVATTSAAQSVTLKNTGTASLSISTLAASGSFAETNNCGSSLAASASCTISVTFAPTASGTLTGGITLTDNAASSPQAVSLTGTAVAATQPQVTLSWTESSTSVSGYNVYRSTQSGTGYTEINLSLVPTQSYVDNTVSAGQTYYYVVTAVNASGAQSAYSTQVSASVPTS